jgi:hypothetical protein
MPMPKSLRPAVLALALVLSASGGAPAAPPLPSGATGGLAELVGTVWSGTGQLKFTEGQSEVLKCKAYYTRRPEGLGIALRCASAGQSIDLRAVLVATGSQLTGSWEERSFSAAGKATGTLSGPRLVLLVEGAGLKAIMTVTTAGQAQSVSITSEGTRLRAVTIGLSKEPAPK